MNITEFREKYPQYDDMPDEQLAEALHKKHYSDMPREAFDEKFLGKNAELPTEAPTISTLSDEVDAELNGMQTDTWGKTIGKVVDEVFGQPEEPAVQTSPLDDIASQMSTTIQTMYNAQKVHNINSGMDEEQARTAAFDYVQNTPQGKIDLERVKTQQAQAEVENQQSIVEQQAKEQEKTVEAQQKKTLKIQEQQADINEHEIIDIATIPETLTIEESIMNKTGQSTKIKTNAREAYTASHERVSRYKSLLECLRS